MQVERLQKLTDAQREALRLVMAGFKSKEIAHQLGVTEDAINKRLTAAMATLQAPSRFVAARLLAAWEAEAASDSLVGQTLPLEADAPFPVKVGSTAPSDRTAASGESARVEEAQIPYDPRPAETPMIALTEHQDEISPEPSMFAISPPIAFVAMALIGALIALVPALFRFAGS